MLLVLFSGFGLGCCFTFIAVKASKLSRRDRIEATLETIHELQKVFCQATDAGGTFDKLDDVRVVVEGMKRQ